MRTSQKWALAGSLGLTTLILVGLASNGGFQRPRGGGAPLAMRVMAPLLNESQDVQTQAEAPPPSGRVSPMAALDALAASQRLIRSGSLSLEVQAFDVALGRVQAIAAARGGYVADLRAQRPEKGRAQGTMTIRVLPAQTFAALDDLRGLGRVESEGLQTQDVTKAYADLEARLRNKRDMELRMRELLRTRTGKLSEVLEAEQQLSEVTEEIERMEGERRYYQQMTGLSTLTLDLHEPMAVAPPAPQPTPLLEPVRQAWLRSREVVVETFAFFILGAATLAPWSLLGLAGWWLLRRLRSRAQAASTPA